MRVIQPTLLLVLLFYVPYLGVHVKGDGAGGNALGALYFSLENADVPTLYQEVRVKIRSDPTPISPPSQVPVKVSRAFKASDKVYFIDTTEAEKTCTTSPPNGGLSVNVASDGNSAVVHIIIKNPDFTVGKTYKMCYIKEATTSVAAAAYDVVYETTSTLIKGKDTPKFTVLSSIYTKYVIAPTTVYAGQGPVTLSITNPTVTAGRTFGNGQVTRRPYLLPCRKEDCMKKNEMAPLCSKFNQGTVTTGAVTGFGTDTLTTTFFAPVTPAASYMICVPYCFKASSCGSVVSWALVDSSTPITFQPTNPSSYTIDPSSTNTLTFTGTGLKKGDKIRILKKGELCPISSTLALQNIEYTDVTATSATDSESKFTLSAVLAASVTGQVCYSRVETPTVWAPVFQAADKAPLYFSLESAQHPTLYQEVLVKVRKGSTAQVSAFVFDYTDKIYFMEATGNCLTCTGNVGDKCAPDGVTLWNVRNINTGENSALVPVIIGNPYFTVGKTYKMCYIKGKADTATVSYEASYTLIDGIETSVKFTVRSMFTGHKMMPTTVYAGQGPIELSITVAKLVWADRTFRTLGTPQRPYLIPCPNGDCSDKIQIASLCSAKNPTAVPTGEVTGFGTGTLTTTFFAPEAPAASYMICVPYCFKASSCGSVVSWALVDSSTPITFQPANPSSYTNYQSSPNTLIFTGTSLKKGDKIRILKNGMKCPNSFASQFINDQYTEVTATCPIGVSDTSSISKFTISIPVTGQVCYSRAGSSTVWAPVSRSPKQTLLYYSLENADVPTLYQEVSVKVRKHTTGDPTGEKDPAFGPTDKFYFIDTTGTEAKQCEVSPPNGVSLRTVKVGADGASAVATVVIKNTDFKVGKTYKMCYIKKDTRDSCGIAYEALYTSSDTDQTTTDFTILSSIYTKYVITPTTVYAGQGPVTLSITNPTVTAGRTFGNGQVTRRPYLIPCLGTGCSKDQIASFCSLTTNEGTVTTGEVTGFGTRTLTTTFIAPVTPADSYMICVPYCFKAGECDRLVSWALVDSSTPITFQPAKPGPQMPPKPDVSPNKGSKPDTVAKVPPKVGVTVPTMPDVNKSTTLSATAISSTTPAVLITSVVFLYLYNW